jgi:hypothetical protein
MTASATGGCNDSSSTLNLDNLKAEFEDNACPIHIGERLGKLEQLFEKFVCRKFSSASASSDKQRSSTPSASSDEKMFKFLDLPEISSDAQSISTIGEGIVSLPYFFPCNVPC